MNTYSQTITNIQSHQDENCIIVSYTLKSEKAVDIELYYSDNDGVNYSGPLKSISGDVSYLYNGNYNIKWNLLQDLPYLAGEKIIFKINCVQSRYDSFTDKRDGIVYKTVKIGNQIIMAENLAYKPNSGNYWAYNNDLNNVNKHGYLYDWKTAQKIAPNGWHLPTKEEWETLFKYLGGDEKLLYEVLKDGGSSGFNALLDGLFDNKEGKFSNLDVKSTYWSATARDSKAAWTFDISSQFKYGELWCFYRYYGYSVRLFRD